MTLPPLPEPHLLVFDAALQSPIDGWTRSQVEAYARVAVEAEREDTRAECDALREANERFGKRQAWWTRTMFESESNRECLQAERDALRALLAEAMPELLGELWQESRICSVCFGHNRHSDVCLVARIDAALRSE